MRARLRHFKQRYRALAPRQQRRHSPSRTRLPLARPPLRTQVKLPRVKPCRVRRKPSHLCPALDRRNLNRRCRVVARGPSRLRRRSQQRSVFNGKNPDFLLKNLDFSLKNPDFLLKNPDFLLKNVDSIIRQVKLKAKPGTATAPAPNARGADYKARRVALGSLDGVLGDEHEGDVQAFESSFRSVFNGRILISY